MSIRDAVQEYCRRDVLHKLLLPGYAGTERREVCLSDKINPLITGPWQDGAHMSVCQRVAAGLMAIIEQEIITVREGPPTDDDAQVARLVPHDIIELRCFKAEPSVRILGYVAEKNLHIGLIWRFRHQLGSFGSPEWESAIRECETDWIALFPFYAPVTGGRFPDDYFVGTIPARDR